MMDTIIGKLYTRNGWYIREVWLDKHTPPPDIIRLDDEYYRYSHNQDQRLVYMGATLHVIREVAAGRG